jgi:ribosomal protein L34
VKPRWNCRNEADRKRLEEWTLDQFNKLDDQLVTERDIEIMQLMNSDEFFEWSDQQSKREQQRGRVVKAAKAKDANLIQRLTANDPELQQLAVRVLTHRRGKGRPKGSWPTDIPEEKRIALARAAADVRRIYDLWKRKLGFRYRTQTPTAVEIAARRWGFDDDELKRFRRNFAS